MCGNDRSFSRDIIIINELGLHARTAGMIAKLAAKTKSKVWIFKDGEKADASSIIDILTLCCTKGSKITIEINISADIEILNSIEELVSRGFGE